MGLLIKHLAVVAIERTTIIFSEVLFDEWYVASRA
jgi:hypothetical protein